jgi:glutamate/tyrosine decarboxylase-like PLP-dependent enzyme
VTYTAALGDFLAATTNRYVGLYFTAPGAVRLEHSLVRFIAKEVGYPEDCGGDLTSGGSIGNLSAVVTARDAHDVLAGDVSRTVVYLSDHTHHSIAKALRIAGLGRAQTRHIALDERYRMRPEALAQAIAADHAAGLRPWLVVASAGTTDTGAVDPLHAIADVAKAERLWLHVDGAYGAAFALTAPGKDVLAGLERSDSLIIDPHKGLFMPFGIGVVLVKDRAAMERAHHYCAAYLRDTALHPADEVSPAECSPELSRPFRGLKLWLSLKVAGVAAFRAALEEKLLLARYFHARMSEVDGVEVGPTPDLSIALFRFTFAGKDSNERNTRLALRLQQDGRVFVSSTTLADPQADDPAGRKVWLRLAVLNARSHQDTVERAIAVINELAAGVAREG